MFQWVTDALEWLWQVLLYIPKWIVQSILEALANVINSIPVPDFVSSAPGLFLQVPAGVWWFASVAQLDVGIPMVFGAYALRFLIRRIPIIG